MTSKFALVIANTDYQDETLDKLTAPGRDAEDFARVLREPQLAGFDDVQVLLNESDEKTRRAIARFFSNRKPEDLLLLYFSGHGVRNDQGHLFLAANDTEIGILEATGIPSEFITDLMNKSRSRRQLLILDCCNSGAFAHGGKSSTALGKSMGMAEAFEGNGFGRIVLTASDATQFAWEGDRVIGKTENSVFTHFLIIGLNGEADRDGDGKITVDELYDFVYEQVVHHTPKQTPGKWSYKEQGNIVLRDNVTSSEVKPALLPVETAEMLNDTSARVRDLGVQDLAKLLTGKHIGLTRAAEDKLREIAANDDSLNLRKTASNILASHGISVNPILSDEEKNAEREAAEKEAALVKEKLEAQEKAERDAVERAALLKADEIAENATRKAALEKTQRDAAQKAKEKKSIVNSLRIALGGFGFLFVLGFFIIGIFLVVRWRLSLATPTPTVTPIATEVSVQEEPIAFPVATDPLIVTDVPTEAPVFGIGSTITGTEGMSLLYVPAGEFTMGSDKGDPDEKPVHKVTLDAFWIDKTEVTNKMYSMCVAADGCNQPAHTGSFTNSRYYDNREFDDYPVIYVDWNMAKTYCEWAGRDLPTEAQWEKAARGLDANMYPWGNIFNGKSVNFCDANCSYHSANKKYNDNYADVSPVGNYPSGQSVYGALDMAGNVWEWVDDWYDVYPNGTTTSSKFGQKYRVLRGGSWSVNMHDVRSADRYFVDLTDSYNYFSGFRCALNQ